jgi:hypothetical protein
MSPSSISLWYFSDLVKMSETVSSSNDVSTKPVKINKWETNALKNALDDACKKV